VGISGLGDRGGIGGCGGRRECPRARRRAWRDGRFGVDGIVVNYRWEKSLGSAEERWNGPGSEADKIVKSSGTMRLDLALWSALLFTLSETTGE
jgi:hypothetical protein